MLPDIMAEGCKEDVVDLSLAALCALCATLACGSSYGHGD